MITYDVETLEFYDAHAPDYLAAGPQGTSRNLSGFMALLPMPAKVLDLGCGGGRDAQAMLEAGLEVHATDGSRSMARQAEARLSRTVRVMRFDELESIEEFDGVWASASLLHVPRAELAATLALVHGSLKTGGLHCASYKVGALEGRDRVGRYFNYLQADELLDAYSTSGRWQMISVSEYEGSGYASGPGPWAAITLRRA